MKERLQTILSLENISAAQLASLLGIQRSTLSNLMRGRNKPSYDLILAILTKLPNLNLDWLLKGEGQPYRNSGLNLRGMRLNNTNAKDEKNTTSMSYNDTNSSSEEVGQIMRSNDSKNKQHEEKAVLSIFDATDTPDYNNGNLFGFMDEKKEKKEEKEPTGVKEALDGKDVTDGNVSDDFPLDVEDFPSEDENPTYHPYPALEEGELNKRLEMMQSIKDKGITDENKASEPSENPKFEESLDPHRQILKPEPHKRPVKIILLYSDGSFELFDR